MPTHNYLNKYPISPNSEKLILGTIHPDKTKFKVDFFYGHRPMLWKILHDAYPSELTDHLNLNAILAFLHKHKIAISDTIKSCNRKNPTAMDSDLTDIELNTNLISQIKHSSITKIYFTSGFGANNAFRLFYEKILNLKLTAEIKTNRSIQLDQNIFGRPIDLILLYSPSGAANISISKSKEYMENIEKYKHFSKKIHQFKVDSYKNVFAL